MSKKDTTGQDLGVDCHIYVAAATTTPVEQPGSTLLSRESVAYLQLFCVSSLLSPGHLPYGISRVDFSSRQVFCRAVFSKMLCQKLLKKVDGSVFPKKMMFEFFENYLGGRLRTTFKNANPAPKKLIKRGYFSPPTAGKSFS